MFWSRLLGRGPSRLAVHATYDAVVAQARRPAFYASHGVPDTLDGRFELIALHIFLVLHRLRGAAEAQGFGQALFNMFFADMDRSLREMGTGDLSVGKQVKSMATAFYGRVSTYQAGIAGEGDLEEALRRNLFGTVEHPADVDVAWFAAYLKAQAAALAARPIVAITGGALEFAAPVE